MTPIKLPYPLSCLRREAFHGCQADDSFIALLARRNQKQGLQLQ